MAAARSPPWMVMTVHSPRLRAAAAVVETRAAGAGDGGTVRPEVGPRGRRSHDEMHSFLVVDRQAVEGQGAVDRATDGLIEQHFPGGHLKVGAWLHDW